MTRHGAGGDGRRRDRGRGAPGRSSRSAGIESELEIAVEHDPLGTEDAPQKVLVPEDVARGGAARDRGDDRAGGHRRPTPDGASDFGALAGRYDELRPADEQLVGGLRARSSRGDLRGPARARHRLRDGTARGGARGARGSQGLGRRAGARDGRGRSRAGAVSTRQGGARPSELPFKDGWFERAPMWLVVHLVDRPRAFAEARRVLSARGRLAIGTFSPGALRAYWLKRFFPSLQAIDKAEGFPRLGRADSTRSSTAAGFERVEQHRLTQTRAVDRETAVERVRGRFISPFQLLDEARAGGRAARGWRPSFPSATSTRSSGSSRSLTGSARTSRRCARGGRPGGRGGRSRSSRGTRPGSAPSRRCGRGGGAS